MSELYWPCFRRHANQYVRSGGYIVAEDQVDGVPADALPGSFPQDKVSAWLMVTLYLIDERAKEVQR